MIIQENAGIDLMLAQTDLLVMTGHSPISVVPSYSSRNVAYVFFFLICPLISSVFLDNCISVMSTECKSSYTFSFHSNKENNFGMP